MNREKVQIKRSKIEQILYDYVNFSDESENVTTKNWFKMSTIHWFLKYFDVYINKNVSLEERNKMGSFFTSEERQFAQCSCLKIEQKPKVDLDFTNYTNLPGDSNPYKSFNLMQKVLYEDFFNNIPNNVESQLQILIEITVEFVKTETSGNGVVNDWEQEFFTGDGTVECVEQRSIKEYSAFSCGSIEGFLFVYNEAVSELSKKILNSYVTGSNWSLRRIISSNLSILHNIDAKFFTQRLIKGKSPAPSSSSPPVGLLDVDNFYRLFHMC